MPNLKEFKEKMIKQLERKKENADRLAKLSKLKQKNSERSRSTKTIEEYASEATAAVRENALKITMNPEEEDKDGRMIERTKKNYLKELQKVIADSDVILQVLDARDPLGCRSKELESHIIAKSKKIVLVLNKIDLVPVYEKSEYNKDRKAAMDWCAYLRREYATVMFKANTQSQAERLSDINLQPKKLKDDPAKYKAVTSSAKTVGGEDLLQVIKNYGRTDGVATSITVGVIGFPNVGKSSIINSLKRSKVAPVSNIPGYTKTIQEIYLDHNVRLLDCPGVMLSNDNSDSVILRNVVKIEDLADPYVPVAALIKRVPRETLLTLYEVPEFATPQEFLANVARKRGRLMKGGVPNTEQAAREVLRDWNNGKIPFSTPCPETEGAAGSVRNF